jgi:hypothetical protein
MELQELTKSLKWIVNNLEQIDIDDKQLRLVKDK